MKKLIYILWFLPLAMLGQTENENYVVSRVYRDSSSVSNPNKSNTVITYIDGLGRPIQTIAVAAGGNNEDILTPIVYDQYGQEVKKYLPYAQHNTGGSLEIRDNADIIGNLNNYYHERNNEDISGSAPNPYSETRYEASPLNRVLEQAAPGKNWSLASGHTIKFSYNTNRLKEVRRFAVNFTDTLDTELPKLDYDGFYPPGKLYKTVTKDENWTPNDLYLKTTQEFKDKDGHVVLKRTFNLINGIIEPHDTYYVYDFFGNLTYVIPPLASDQIVTGGSNPTSYTGRNYSWVNLVDVDQRFADDYNRLLMDYDNESILSTDLQNQYGGQGGFTVTPRAGGELTLTLNFAVNDSLPLRRGVLLRLNDMGTFADKELGRISGDGYTYVFAIQDNVIKVEGDGYIPSLNVTLNSEDKLAYAKNYPWTAFCGVDGATKADYEAALEHVLNSEVLTVQIPNSRDTYGGLGMALDEEDNLSIHLLIDAVHGADIDTHAVIPLEIARSLRDTIIGSFDSPDYSYRLELRDNSLFFTGSGTFTILDQQWTIPLLPRPVINDAVVDGLCYEYHYDSRNRVVEKHIPGKGWEMTVYDKLDRPALTQDTNLRRDKEWLFTRYDDFGRTAYTGKFTYAMPRPSPLDTAPLLTSERRRMQRMVNDNTILSERREATGFSSGEGFVNYSRFVSPKDGDALVSDFTVLSVAYYDNYTMQPFGQPVTMPASNSYATALSTATKSLPTASMVRVLGTPAWIFSLSGYDDRGRLVYTKSSNPFLQTTDTGNLNLDYMGKVTESRTEHTRTGSISGLVTANKFWYDNTGRLLKQASTIGGGGDELIVYNRYDELGQLRAKKTGGANASTYNDAAALQEVDYRYNIRGWLRKINNPDAPLGNKLFAFKIDYDQPGGDGTSLYNGNISATYWRVKGDDKKRSYTYEYDALNRLTDANYAIPYYNPQVHQIDNYNEGILQYDKNGNILHLERYGIKADGSAIDKIDELNYLYAPTSNKLVQVTDAGDAAGFSDVTPNNGIDYKYDGNGNMISDVNKDIESITYNHLNLPTRIIFKGGNPQGSSPKYITYMYDAAGTKLEKKVIRTPDGQPTVTTVTQYANGYIYENNVLQYFGHAEGYVAHDNGNFKYIYQYKDHLGNVRVSYAKGENGLELIEENNYYAFGLKHKGYGAAYNLASGNAAAQNIRYNGKEFQEELGLNLYSMDWRSYDPAIGRWTGIDPVTHHDMSPYNAFDNNPVFWSDPSGADAIVWKNGVEFTGNDAGNFWRALMSSRKTGTGYFKLGGTENIVTDWDYIYEINNEDKSNAGADGGEDWIKNNATGEVRWFEGMGQEATDRANAYWRFFNSAGQTTNLGSSFFWTSGQTVVDNFQMNNQQVQYLLLCALKINAMAGVPNDAFIQDNIAFEYLKNVFINKNNSSKELPNLLKFVWDNGGADYVEGKMPKSIATKIIFKGIDLYLNPDNLAIGGDRGAHMRADAVKFFKKYTINYITPTLLFKINSHSF